MPLVTYRALQAGMARSWRRARSRTGIGCVSCLPGANFCHNDNVRGDIEFEDERDRVVQLQIDRTLTELHESHVVAAIHDDALCKEEAEQGNANGPRMRSMKHIVLLNSV